MNNETNNTKKKPSVLAPYREQFANLCLALKIGDAVLVDCRNRATGEAEAVICILTEYPDGSAGVSPIAVMLKGDVLSQYDPPGTEGTYEDTNLLRGKEGLQ